MDYHQPLKTRMERLLKRLMDGCVVPFVGAGISQGATTKDHPKFKPTADFMIEALRTEFKKQHENGDLHESLYDIIFDENKDKENKKDEENKKDKLNLDRLSEIGTWLWGSKKVCETILSQKRRGPKDHFNRKAASYISEGIMGKGSFQRPGETEEPVLLRFRQRRTSSAAYGFSYL